MNIIVLPVLGQARIEVCNAEAPAKRRMDYKRRSVKGLNESFHVQIVRGSSNGSKGA